MRPTTSTMLQQNNNNNYPCLNVSGSTREMLQKCSRASLPFPSRLELGLGDLPLIRGLRAWALCSKNRRKAGSLLGAGQAPTAPPAGRGGSTSCPRPADVYLSGEWGRMGYGLPLGLDAGQAGIGALVTVATLKTSEGSGKTQTQCLFLRTEKGSCLYSTSKPGSGSTTSAASGVVGGWLRGKTGSRDTPAGRRDNGPAPPVQTGANRVRVRSGRRWRKSCNAAGREKTSVSRERQQGGGEDPAEGISLEERQEERDKGGLDGKQFPSPPQDSRRAKQEKEGAVRSPRCCHNSSPKACAHCGRRAPRRGSQDEHEGGESPRRGGKGIKKERQKTEEEEEEEEEKGGLCGSESSNSVSALPNADPESHSCDVEEIRGAESNEELKTQTSRSKDDNHKEDDTNSEAEVKIDSENNDFPRGRSDDFKSRHNGDFNDRKPSEAPCEEAAAKVNGFSDHEEANQVSEEMMACVDVEEEEGSINQTPAETSIASSRSEDVPVSAEPSGAVEGSTCNAEHETYVQKEQENREDGRQGAADLGVVGKEEQGISRFGQHEPNCVSDVNNTVNENKETPTFFKNAENSSRVEETEASSSPLRHEEPSVFDIDGRIVAGNSKSEIKGAEHELLWENREEESHGEKTEEVVNPKEGGKAGEGTCNKPDDDDEERHPEVDIYDSGVQEDDCEDVRRDRALKDDWRSREPADWRRRRKSDVGDTCGQTSTSHAEANGEAGADVTDVARADPSTALALSPANPAPSLPPLGAMATSLPCLEAEEEEKEEEEGVGVTAGDGEGGQRGKRRELEEPGQEERGSTVATEEGRKEEEEEEEEEEEDEFGVFMQADGEPAWSEGSTMSASVPCGSRESVALGHHAITRESTHWTPGWTDSSFHQSDDTWTAFPQDSSDERRDAAGQWWPTSAVEESRDGLSANQNLASLFAEAFPSLSGSSSGDSRDLDTVPTLTQLLGGRAGQDQGLLDSFHDLNKMICQRYKRANVVSRDLLLKTLHLQQPHAESQPAPRTANRRHSPGLPSANQHAQNAAAKRRLSYDYNRNIME